MFVTTATSTIRPRVNQTDYQISLAVRPRLRTQPPSETIVHLDVAHRGLGTASCGPDTLPQYLVGPGTYKWSWSIGPLGPPRRR
jgi:hypothetical protein